MADYLTPQRRRAILEMRRSGFSSQQIADNLGIEWEDAVPIIREVMDGIVSATTENVASGRALDLLRIDEAIKAVSPAADMGDPKSIDALMKLLDRRAKLAGLDAPTRSQSQTIFAQYTEAELLDQAARLGISVDQKAIEHG
jgi:hypothetical protein